MGARSKYALRPPETRRRTKAVFSLEGRKFECSGRHYCKLELSTHSLVDHYGLKHFRKGDVHPPCKKGTAHFQPFIVMDEAALKTGADPLAFRLKHLDAAGTNAGSAPNVVGGALRQTNVIERVAKLSGYGRTDPGEDTAIGIANTSEDT